jgi:RNA polymerase sigma-B factor
MSSSHRRQAAIGAHAPANGNADRNRQTLRLLTRYHRERDLAARDELVRRFLPLARQLARRYSRGREPLDDLIQVACVGLVKAVDRFDLDRRTSFSSYAVPMMLGELRRHFRDSGWALHVPRAVQERVLELDGLSKDIAARTGRSPTANKLAELSRWPLEDVVEALGASRSAETVSLDATRSSDGADGDSRGDTIGDIDGSFELVELGLAIAPTLRAMPERDRQVLALRFYGDLTQTEIAECLGVSQMQVSRLLRRSLERLRTVANGAPPRQQTG